MNTYTLINTMNPVSATELRKISAIHSDRLKLETEQKYQNWIRYAHSFVISGASEGRSEQKIQWGEQSIRNVSRAMKELAELFPDTVITTDPRLLSIGIPDNKSFLNNYIVVSWGQ